MRKITLSIILVLLCTASAWCAQWDARTRRTNTSIQDSDIQAALSQGLSQQFPRTFPIRHYGVYVLVDRTVGVDHRNDIVYVMFGLCKRRGDGSYELPEVTYSTVLLVPAGNRSQELNLTRQRLAQQAAEFSKLAVDNASRLK
jgi:hypothetical protein